MKMSMHRVIIIFIVFLNPTVSKKIICIDEERATYDLTKWVKDNEYNLFPTIHPDFLDALSRIYDMDPMPPRTSGRGRSLEPPAEAAY